jgi:hypothetical protein
MGGLYESGILGSGDHIMALSLIGRGLKAVNDLSTYNYKDSIKQFENRIKNLRIGYVPGVIRHHYHGSKKNRKYSERWAILIQNNYDPYEHIKNDEYGVLIPTYNCPPKLLEDILNYFKERNEDEDFSDLKLY